MYGRQIEMRNWKNKIESIVHVRISLAMISQETDNGYYIYNPSFRAFSISKHVETIRASRGLELQTVHPKTFDLNQR